MNLSIITINYNNAVGFLKTIQSVISQTYLDYEFIVIDGASKDNSKEIIEQYVDDIDYWISEPDSGIYNAMNKGLKQAKGDFLLFLNSGDSFIDSNVLEKVFSSKIDSNTAFIRGNQITNYENGTKERWINFGDRELTLYDMYTSSLHHQATFFRRESFEKYGTYNETYKIISDWEHSLKMVLGNEKSQYLNIDIVSYPYGGISSNSEGLVKRKKEREKALETHLPRNILQDYKILEDLKTYKEKKTFEEMLAEFITKHKLPLFLFRAISKMYRMLGIDKS